VHGRKVVLIMTTDVQCVDTCPVWAVSGTWS